MGLIPNKAVWCRSCKDHPSRLVLEDAIDKVLTFLRQCPWGWPWTHIHTILSQETWKLCHSQELDFGKTHMDVRTVSSTVTEHLRQEADLKSMPFSHSHCTGHSVEFIQNDGSDRWSSESARHCHRPSTDLLGPLQFHTDHMRTRDESE